MTVPLPIGRAAALVGVPAWKIRDWESKGLIVPLRKESGHRVFGEAEMRRLAELRDLLLADPALDATFRSSAAPAPAAAVPVSPPPVQTAPTTAADARQRTRAEGGAGGTDPAPSIRPQSGEDRAAELGAAAIRLANASGGFESLGPALEFALDTALELTNARVGTISYADLTRQRYVLSAHRGLSMGYVKGIESWQLDEGLAGRAYSMREPVLIDDLAEDPLVPRSIVHEEGLRGYICVPILRGGRRLGIIEVISKARSAFTTDDVRAVELVGNSIAAAIETSRLNDELEFFRSQRDNISRHWMTQLGRAVEDLQARTMGEILALADDVRDRPAFDREAVDQDLRELAAGLSRAHAMTVNLRETVLSHIVDGGDYLRDRRLSLDVNECDVNVEHGFAGKVLELLERLVSQVAHSAQQRVSVRLEVGDSLEIEVHDDVERPNRADFVQSLSAECTRLLKSLDAEAKSPVIGFGYSTVRVRIPLQVSDMALQRLTPKELEVLSLLSRGYTNRELARELFISPKTLQNHLTAIYRKFGVKNRTEAIAMSSSHR